MEPLNPYRELARTKKAVQLADTLAGYGFTAAMVRAMSQHHWAMAATAARVKLPSKNVQEIVIRTLEARGVGRLNARKIGTDKLTLVAKDQQGARSRMAGASGEAK